MRHYKRFLALVLVVATLLSFALVANAADARYYDANEITHTTAVDVLSAVGVINGYEDGTFAPTGEVTRAEMAKILAFVLNGGEDVGESYVSACTFADAQNHWAKGYIGFCVSAGLINGKNATTFDPNGQVTGYEVTKMLLCALGYKADLIGLVGANWNTTAHSYAIKLSLLDYLTEYAPAEPMNREDSCQMIFNALQTTMVETTGNIVEIDGITIAQNVATIPLAQTGYDYASRADEDPDTAGNQQYQQLIEDVFPNLKKVSSTTHDPFGRPSAEWKYKNETLGVYALPALKSTDSSLKGSDVVKAIGNASVRSAEVFINGTNLGTVTIEELSANIGLSAAKIKAQDYDETAPLIYSYYGSSLMNSKNFPASVLAQVLANYKTSFQYSSHEYDDGSSRSTYGFHSEAFFDAATGKVTLINNNYFYGKVVSVRNTVLDEDDNVIYPGYVMVAPINGHSYAVPSPYAPIQVNDTIVIPGGAQLPILLDKIDTGEDEETVKVGDYLVYNIGCADRNAQSKTYVAENAKLMHRITVTAEKVTRTSSQGSLRSYDTVVGTDGVTYRPNYSSGTRALHAAGTTYDFICAKFGSRFYHYRTESYIGNYMYLYDATTSSNALTGGYVAKLVNPDGTTQIVETDQLYRNLVGSVVTGTVNPAGKTVLTSVGSFSGNFGVQVSVTNSNSNVTFDNVTKVADAATRFVISQLDSNGTETFTTYIGINKVPNIQAGQYYAYVTNQSGVLDTVYILNATGISSTVQEGFVFKSSGKDVAITTDSTYYELPALVNGQLSTLKVSPTAYNNLSGNGFHLFGSYTTDSFGNVESFSTISGTAINSFTPANAGNIFLNGVPFTYHDNVLVYTYSIIGGTVAESTVEALQDLNFGTFTSYYTLHQTYPGTPLAAIFAIIP